MVKLASRIKSYLWGFEETFSLPKATFIIGACTLLAKFVSLFRVNIFASRFAAGDYADVYFSAFRVPDLIFNMLILGTLSVAFIPVYTQLKYKDKEEALRLANTTLNFVFISILFVCLGVFIFSRPITHYIVPGFDGEKFEATLKFTRILLLSPIIFTISNVFSSILTSHKKFLLVSLAPTFYNVGIIIGILFIYPFMGFYGLAVGVLFGAFLHALVQVREVWKTGFRYKFVLNLKGKAFKSFIRLFIPRMFAFDSNNVSLIIGSMLGSSLATGSVAVFNYAFDLQSVPLGIFAFSAAAAAFPALTEAFAEQKPDEYASILSKSMLRVLFFVVPCSIALLVFRAQIVRILLGHGNFGWEETIITFTCLGVFSLSLAAQALIPLFSRAFYSQHNTIIPVITGVLSMFINAFVGYYLHVRLGVIGIASGFTAASVFNCLVLFVILRFYTMNNNNFKETLKNFDNQIVNGILRVVLASALFGAVGYGMLYFGSRFVSTSTTLGLIVQTGFSASVASVMYILFSSFIGIPEAINMVQFAKKYLRLESSANKLVK